MMTKQFRPLYPGQEGDNAVYQLYLRRPRQEEELSLLQWLRNHSISNNNAKALASNLNRLHNWNCEWLSRPNIALRDGDDDKR